MNEFDKILQDQLKNGERQTPAFIWENIEQAIDPPKRPKWLIFWISLLGLILLFGLSTLIYFQVEPTTQVVLSQQDSTDTLSFPLDSVPTSSIPLNNAKEETSSHNPVSTLSSASNVPRPLVLPQTSQAKPKVNPPQNPQIVQTEPKQAEKQRIQSAAAQSDKLNQTTIHPKIAALFVPVIQADELLPTPASTIGDSSQGDHRTLASSFRLYRLQRNDSLLLDFPLHPLDSSITAVAVPELTPLKKPGKFFIEAKLGYSAYQMSLWDEFFLVGALSGRPFPANGYNINLETGYSFNRWLTPIIGFNLNHKNARFIYDALYDDQGYFDYDIRGNAICIHDINNGDYLCNKYLLEDIEADFSIRSYSLTLGNRFNLFQTLRIGMGLDLKYSLDLRSTVALNSITKIDVSDYLSQSYNSRAAAGLNLNFKLSERTRLFIYPEYIYMPAKDEHKLYKGPLQEFITSFGIRINL
ncbi:MAG: hypothetical protein AAF927_04810 [Bacteroidota bacterium]